jgi:N-acetylmuramoyl-L-alanine amidase
MARVLTALILTALFAHPASAGQPLTNVDTVAIDAGHGDDDPGSSRGDALEKMQCALVAQALKGVIERENGPSVKIVFTFKPEGNTSQRERAYAANSNGAKVFVSIHGFPSWQPEAGIYIPAPPDINPPSWKNTAGKFLAKSSQLAEKLKPALDSSNPEKKHFVTFGQLRVFNGVTAPSVAVEAVALDPQHPLTPESAEKIALAIYSGLVEFGKTP